LPQWPARSTFEADCLAPIALALHAEVHMEWVAPLVTLTAMEIVLGIDNVIFIAILVQRLPASQQANARRLGLGLALVMRLGLLFAIKWIMGLTEPIFRLTDLGLPETWLYARSEAAELVLEERNVVSWRDVILLGGGLFLIAKSVHELHAKLEGDHGPKGAGKSAAAFGMVLFQIAILDIVFSLDSVITAVGMAEEIWVMVTAMVIAVAVMLVFAAKISQFVSRHPTLKILALSFLILIGVLLVAEGTGVHVNRAYLYFAMAFALAVEILNIRFRAKSAAVQLHEPPPVEA
jgi:predicted tellurium resistance membrane protein TerC